MFTNKKVLAEGFRINSQTPVDDRLVVKDASFLSNLEPFRLYEGLRVWLLAENKECIWRENLGSEVGLNSSDFVYPAGTVAQSIDYSSRSFNFFYTDASANSCLFDAQVESLGSCSGGNILVKSHFQFKPEVISYGPEINFVHSDGGSEVDVITAGLTEITRGLTQPIFNIAAEPAYDPFLGGPSNTEWNSVFVDPLNFGFSNLTNVTTRTFGSFADALDNTIGSNVLTTDLVMREISTGRLFTVVFTAWTTTSGGGFAYKRKEILSVDPPKGLVFSDGSFQSTGAAILSSGSPNVTLTETFDALNVRHISITVASNTVNIGNTLFVSTTGNDVTAQPYNLNLPYSTISKAVNAAAVGDTVIVFPGSYSSFDNLLRDQVNLVFLGVGTVSGAGHMFVNSGVAINTKIFAPGWTFSTNGSVVYLTGANAVDFSFTFDRIIGGGGPHTLLDLTGTNFVSMSGNYAHGAYYGLNLRSASSGVFDIKTLSSTTYHAIFIRQGTTSASGKAHIYFEDLVFNSRPGNYAIAAQAIDVGSDYVIRGTSKQTIGGDLMLFQGVSVGKVTLDLHMVEPCTGTLLVSNFGSLSTLELTGKFKSNGRSFTVDNTNCYYILKNIFVENLQGDLGYINNLGNHLILDGFVYLKDLLGTAPFTLDVSKILNYGRTIVHTNAANSLSASMLTDFINMGSLSDNVASALLNVLVNAEQTSALISLEL